MTEANNEAAVRLWFRMLRLHTRSTLAIGKRLKGLGLSIPQSDVLSTLTEREGVTQQELAARLYVTKGNISGLVDRLVEAGHVERRAAETDRRSHAIYLTPAGRQLALLSIQAQRTFVAETFGQLKPQQIAEFEALLIASRDLVRARADGIQSTPRMLSAGHEPPRRRAFG